MSSPKMIRKAAFMSDAAVGSKRLTATHIAFHSAQDAGRLLRSPSYDRLGLECPPCDDGGSTGLSGLCRAAGTLYPVRLWVWTLL